MFSFDMLVELLRGRRLVVLTGAGISTESGIPDYRGEETRKKARHPIQHKAFVTDAATRARYWARGTLGWPRFRAFEPNPAHHAIAALQREQVVTALITQNVDQLHQKAGSRDVIELHGSLFEVRCLDCGGLEARDSVQARLLEENPSALEWHHELAPDGDAEFAPEALEAFRVPSCLTCGGVLKPDVVFFGDSVPRERVERAFALVEAAEVLLVVGSSLAVFSGYRFVLHAVERALPVALVNLGESRGQAHAKVHVNASAGVVLPRLVERLRSVG